jgi:hypothetical protein
MITAIATARDKAKSFLLANALIVMAVLLALLAVQTIRIDGFRVPVPFVGAVGPVGLKADNEALRAANEALRAEKAAAARLKAQTEAANTRTTEKVNTDVKRNLAQERAGADAFIARGGVRPCPATARTAESGSAAVDAGAGALPVMDEMPVVSVLPEDVRICTENTVKARAWQEWGLGIEANHKPAE